jgi:hypothetical protein
MNSFLVVREVEGVAGGVPFEVVGLLERVVPDRFWTFVYSAKYKGPPIPPFSDRNKGYMTVFGSFPVFGVNLRSDAGPVMRACRFRGDESGLYCLGLELTKCRNLRLGFQVIPDYALYDGRVLVWRKLLDSVEYYDEGRVVDGEEVGLKPAGGLLRVEGSGFVGSWGGIERYLYDRVRGSVKVRVRHAVGAELPDHRVVLFWRQRVDLGSYGELFDLVYGYESMVIFTDV